MRLVKRVRILTAGAPLAKMNPKLAAMTQKAEESKAEAMEVEQRKPDPLFDQIEDGELLVDTAMHEAKEP